MQAPSSIHGRRRLVRMWRIAAYLLLAASYGYGQLAAAAGPRGAGGSVHVAAAAANDADVRRLVLGNGMRVFVLHDAAAEQASAAVAVQTGAWEDPPHAPGMAHFVEHLLFMGNAEYPDEDGFYAYLARHGGSANAYTTVDRTVYMFDADPDGFFAALQRFAAMFARPRLGDASISRERQAVDAECRTKSRSDAWRETMVDAALSDAAHPNHRFDLGSAQGLAHVDHKALQSWFQTHYSAHKMALVVRGPQSLDVLEQAVQAAFAKVPRRLGAVDPVSQPLLASQPMFDAAYAGTVVAIAPVQASTHEMSVKWDLPPGAPQASFAHACQLLAYLLENQGKHALLAHLRAEGLATDIDVMPRHFANGRTLLTVTFELTDAGVAQRDTVLASLFATLQKFHAADALQPLERELGEQIWRGWIWRTPAPGYDTVASMADALLTQKLATFPDVTPHPFAASTWLALLENLSRASARITLLAPDAPSSTPQMGMHVEPRMHVSYRLLAAPQALPNIAGSTAFGIPEANPWMPRNLDVKPPGQGAPTLASPWHLVDDAYASIFVARDAAQSTPRIGMTVDIRVPVAQPQDAPSAALYDLWWQAADADLADLRAQADAAGLHLQVQPTEGGIQVRMVGFADRAPQLLDAALTRLASLGAQVDDASFAAWRVRLARIYTDARHAKPQQLAYQALFDWRMDRAFSVPEKQAALAGLSAQDLAGLAHQMFARAYTQASFFGNIDKSMAWACAASIRRHLAQVPYPHATVPAPEATALARLVAPQQLVVATGAQGGSAVLVQWREAEDTPEDKAASAILGQALEPRFFDTLRTQQQLAYSLHTSGTSRDGQLFRTFAIGPSRLSAPAVAARLHTFFEQFVRGIDAGSIDEATFLAYKATLLRQWAATADQAGPGSERLHWLAFARQEDFTLVHRRLDALQRLDYKTFLRYARGAFATPQRVEVWVDKTP